MTTQTNSEENESANFAVYFDTPVAHGGIRIGELRAWDKQDMVRFSYTRLDGSPYCLDFKDVSAFKTWLYHYFVSSGNIFNDPALKLKFNSIKKD
jgi:hypothetical protein